MADDEEIANIIGILGILTSFLLKLLPTPLFWSIMRGKTVPHQMKPYFFSLALGGSIMWTIYGLLGLPELIHVAINHGAAMVFIMLYMIFFAALSRKDHGLDIAFQLCCMFFASLAYLALVFIPHHDTKSRMLFAGLLIGFYEVVIQILHSWKMIQGDILRHRISFYPIVFGAIDACIWMVYGSLKQDMAIILTSLAGLIVSGAHFVIYLHSEGRPTPQLPVIELAPPIQPAVPAARRRLVDGR